MLSIRPREHTIASCATEISDMVKITKALWRDGSIAERYVQRASVIPSGSITFGFAESEML